MYHEDGELYGRGSQVSAQGQEDGKFDGRGFQVSAG